MTSAVELPLVLEDGTIIASTVFTPDTIAGDAALPVLFLLPGGGMSRRYFDIRLSGAEDYSQARWFAGRGFLVIAMDYPGAGDSSPGDPQNPPSRQAVEQGVEEAVRLVLSRVRMGELVPGLGPVSDVLAIGAGHSVGGHVIVGTQAAHEVFDAIAPLGASMTWTRLQLAPGKRYPFRARGNDAFLATTGCDVDWRNNDHWKDVPRDVVEEDCARDPLPPWRTTKLPLFAGELIEPYASARQAANVRVPVLLVYGEQDVTVEPLEDVATFRAAPSVSLLVVPAMGHSHNLANSRVVAWTRLRLFTEEVAQLRGLGFPGGD